MALEWRNSPEEKRMLELTILRAQPKDGGSYSVSVSDGKTAINSAVARLTFTERTLPFSDDFDLSSRNNLITSPFRNWPG